MPANSARGRQVPDRQAASARQSADDHLRETEHNAGTMVLPSRFGLQQLFVIAPSGILAMDSIIYLVGLIVIVMLILSALGLR